MTLRYLFAMQNRWFPFVLFLTWGQVYGQTGTAPTSLSPGTVATITPKKSTRKARFFEPAHEKTFQYKKPNVRHTARYEFYVRVEQAAKEKQRILKKLAKPQYSNPKYFGHKKMPKRRPPHKMRFCGECGIRH